MALSTPARSSGSTLSDPGATAPRDGSGALGSLTGPRIVTDLPGPKARELLALSTRYEPRSMSDQVPMVWARGERVWLEDVDGNAFLDFTSGVLVVNAGHSHPRLVAAMREQADRVVNTYDFVNEWRPRLAQRALQRPFV